MGRVKRMWEADMDRGYSEVEDTYVCQKCFADEGVRRFITRNRSPGTCSYCNRAVKVCTLDKVIGHVMESIRLEWGDPANEGLPYETREGGWQVAKVYDTWELLEKLGLECSDDLLNTIAGAIHGSAWCEANPYSLPLDRTLVYGWKSFCKFIIETARFVFYKAENARYDHDQHDEMNPVDILEAIGGIVDHLKIVRVVPANSKIFRVRIVNSEVRLTRAHELGSPPSHLATMPNRMSPVGISMFYGAFELDTAISETFDPTCAAGKKAACGEFTAIRELTVIDLSESFFVPSLFDPELQKFRPHYKFMRDFIADFCKPVERSQRAHADYVPTQVVTEYFRHVYRTPKGSRVDGIIYPSSKNGAKAIVVFADSDACVDANSQLDSAALLRLEQVSDICLDVYQRPDDALSF